MKLIGLTGLNAAGKGTVADILKNKGYVYHSLSDIIREEATALGLDHSRENLISTGNKLRQDHGPGALGKMIAEKILAAPEKDYVVDSIRNPFEIQELKKLKGFFIIGVDAPVELRFERSKKRARVGYEKTLQDFIDIEQKENSDDPKKQQLFECLKQADTIIINDKGIAELTKQVEVILSKS